MLPAVTAAADVSVVALASREIGRARRFAASFGGAALRDYAAVLECPAVDAVYVPLPPALRAEWIERALRAGKHVLAEKPLTTSGAETESLLGIADQLGLVLVENVAFPFHSQHETVRRLIGQGVVGTLRHFASAFTFPPRPADDIRNRADLGGGALLDAGVYPIRAAFQVMGGGLRLVGSVLRCDPRTGVDVSGCLLAVTDDGAMATLTFGMEHAYQARYEVTGSRGRLLLDHAFTVSSTHRPVVRVERDDLVEEHRLPPDDQVGKLVAMFAAAIRGGTRPGPHAAESLRQARLVDEVRAAAIQVDSVSC